MKILIIDSHKGSKKMSDNLHLLNASFLAKELNADLIWSYEGVNDNIKYDYDIIIFNHASHYSFVDYAWVENSPNARLFYITNEYNLGEPRALWMAVKRGRKYDVIANHPDKASKVVTKYVNNWNILNLNALVHSEKTYTSEKSGTVYYGSYRKDREPYFKKYLQGDIVVSTHSKNEEKFRNAGVTSNFVKRIKWLDDGLEKYRSSLYIEDVKTHTHYNHLANRFYESISWGVIPIFSEECMNTIQKSGYEIPDKLITNSARKTDLITRALDISPIFCKMILENFNHKAKLEREECFSSIKNILGYVK